MTARATYRTNARNRNAVRNSTPPPATAAVISSITVLSDDKIQVTFATNVIPSKTPLFTAGAGGIAEVSVMTQISATVIDLAFTEDVAGTDLVVKENDPGIRTSAGGFVPAGNYAIPAV